MTASWVVVSIADNKAVLETFNRKIADAINRERYLMLPVGEYLGRFNRGEFRG